MDSLIIRGYTSSPSKKTAVRSTTTSKNTKNDSGEKLTPYQGDRRTCGIFRCKKCNKEWLSANSWANCYQVCKGCNGHIYPHKQFRPEKSDEPREMPPHPEHLCEKCKKLGHSCTERRYRPPINKRYEHSSDKLSSLFQDLSIRNDDSDYDNDY